MKIYLIEGSRGEYSDHSEWIHSAVVTEQLAQERVSSLTKKFKELETKYEDNEYSEEARLALQEMDRDLTGFWGEPAYRYFEIELEAAS